MGERNQKLTTDHPVCSQGFVQKVAQEKQKAEREKGLAQKRVIRFNGIEIENPAEQQESPEYDPSQSLPHHVNVASGLNLKENCHQGTENIIDQGVLEKIQNLAAIGWSMEQIEEFQTDRFKLEGVLTDQEFEHCLDVFLSKQLSFLVWKLILSRSEQKSENCFLNELNCVLKQIRNLMPVFKEVLQKKGWSNQDIQDLIVPHLPIISEAQPMEISEFIEVICDFHLDIEDCKEMKQVSNSSELLLAIRDIAFKKVFKDNVQDLNLEELLKELKKENSSATMNLDSIKNKFLEIEQKILHDSRLSSQGKPINQWNNDNILNWGNHLKKSPALAKNETNLGEILAVIKQAVVLDTKYSPRIIQMLSILILISDNNRGALAQIYTGEGKSLTISMLVILKTLQGHTVDIVTSSGPLAIRDSESKQSLYSIFGMTTAHNVLTDGMGTPKECYLQNIVYGTAYNFQVDILFDEYKLRGTLNKRKPDLIIVDEVDSMLIDQHNHSTLLAVPCPGMDSLTPILKVMWMTLLQHSSTLTPDDKFVFTHEEGKIMEMSAEFYLSQTAKNEIDPEGETSPHFPLSKILKQYALEHIPKWAESALSAHKDYQENKQYLIKNNEVVPLDYENTGVLQENTHWQEGLHQFLQLKHGLPPSRLGLTTNYLSNVGFFRRYGQNIYGLTGTLGSKSCQKLLEDIYKVRLAFIPPHKRRQLIELPAIIADNSNHWMTEICRTITKELKYGRAVLVICNTIADTQRIEEMLKMTDQKFSLKKYIRNDEEQEKIIEKEVGPQEVILATNLAGRGTDIGTSFELEKNGGLAVIVTSLPNNLRVELQAFGRTGRCGKKGTAQLVLNGDENFERLGINFDLYLLRQLSGKKFEDISFGIQDLKEIRDLNEGRRNNHAYKRIEEINLNDELFTKYCQFIGSIPNLRNEEHKCDDIEERWGLWLGKLDRKEPKEKINSYFEQFCNDVRLSLQNADGITNHKYYIREGFRLAEGGQNQPALDLLNRAVSMDPNDWKARHQLACVQAALNQPEAAEENFLSEIALIDIDYQRYSGLMNLVDQTEKNLSSGLADAGAENRHEMREELERGNATSIPFNSNLQNDNLARGQRLERGGYFRESEESKESQINPPLVLGKKENTSLDRLKNNDSSSNRLRSSSKNLQAVKANLQNDLSMLKTLRGNAEENVKKIRAARGNNEDIDIQYEPVTNLISNLNEKQKENLLADGLPKLGSIRTKEKKKKKKNWWGIIGCALLGVAQVVVGCVMSTASGLLLSELGYGLIAEGVNDIIHAGMCAFTDRDFSWKEYGTKKLVSMGLTIALAGYSAYHKLKALGPNSAQTLLGGLPESWTKFKNMPLVVIKEGLTKGIFESNSWKYFPAGFAKNLPLSDKKKVADDIMTQVRHQIEQKGTFNVLKEGEKLEKKLDELQTETEQILRTIITESLKTNNTFIKLVHLSLYSTGAAELFSEKADKLTKEMEDFILNDKQTTEFWKNLEQRLSKEFSDKCDDLSEGLNKLKGIMQSYKLEIQTTVNSTLSRLFQELNGSSNFENCFINEFKKQVTKKFAENKTRIEAMAQSQYRSSSFQNDINNYNQEVQIVKTQILNELAKELVKSIELMNPRGTFNSLQATNRQIENFFNTKYPKMIICKEAVFAAFSEFESRLREKGKEAETRVLRIIVEAFNDSLSKRIMTIVKGQLTNTLERKLNR